jgi:hypothetical protein
MTDDSSFDLSSRHAALAGTRSRDAKLIKLSSACNFRRRKGLAHQALAGGSSMHVTLARIGLFCALHFAAVGTALAYASF